MPFHLPEALLLQAQLQGMACSDPTSVIPAIRRAIAVSLRQQAVVNELRARHALVGWLQKTKSAAAEHERGVLARRARPVPPDVLASLLPDFLQRA
jgi:hypothetical protein